MMSHAVVPPVEQALREWHRIVAGGDLAALPALIHPEVVFRSPVSFTPYRGAPGEALILRTVVGVSSGCTYERLFVAAGGFDVTLESRAQAGEREQKA